MQGFLVHVAFLAVLSFKNLTKIFSETRELQSLDSLWKKDSTTQMQHLIVNLACWLCCP